MSKVEDQGKRFGVHTQACILHLIHCCNYDIKLSVELSNVYSSVRDLYFDKAERKMSKI